MDWLQTHLPTFFRSLRIGDRTLAATLGLLTLALYVRTLLPHVGGTEDTPKFQYLGAVLGTGHSPGYPLYLLVSYMFSWLPVGTLAYRMNLQSACFGAVAVMLAFLVARRLGVHRGIAFAAALSLGAGRAFWFNAVIAEVYSLNAVLWTAATLKLLDWRRDGRDRDLYWATAFVALGLGHHLTIIALFPAAFACLLLSQRRWLRPRTVLTCAGILAAGLAQYAYIWIRTLQGAAFLEARASTFGELVAIVTARRWSGSMFGYDAHTLVGNRLSQVMVVVEREVGWAGLTVAALGLASLSIRDRAAAALLGVGAFVAWALPTNYVLADLGGFLLPAFAMVWFLQAAGFEQLRSMAARRGRLAGVAVVVAAVGLASSQIRANYAANDLHERTFESRYFRAVFEQLPANSGLVIDDYWIEQIVQYGNVSGDFPRDGLPLRLLRADPEGIRVELELGLAVFALPRPASALRGFGFGFEPVTLWGATLAQYLAEVPDNRLVVVATNAEMLPEVFARRFRGTVISRTGVRGLAGAGVMSAAAAAAPVSETTPTRHWESGEAIRGANVSSPASIDIRWAEGTPVVRIADQQVATISPDTDAIVVVLHDDGRIDDVRVFDAEVGFRHLLDLGVWPLTRVTGPGACLAIGDGTWHDVTSVSGAGVNVRLDNFQPFDAWTTVYMWSAWPLFPRLGEFHAGCQSRGVCPPVAEPVLDVTSYRLDTPGDRQRLAKDAAADGLVAPWPADAAHVSRARVTVNDQGQFVTYWLGLGGVPSAVFARAITDAPAERRAGVCAPPPRGLFERGRTRWSFSPVSDQLIDLGHGWAGPEADGIRRLRWTSEPVAALLVPLVRAGRIRLVLEGRAPDATPPPTFRIRVNGHAGDWRPLSSDPRDYEWTFPPEAWRSGLNHVAIEVSRIEQTDRRRLGVAVSGLRFELLD
jgi:hypothetical protein